MTKEEKKEYSKQYYLINKTKMKECSTQWSLNNKNKAQEHRRRWDLENSTYRKQYHDIFGSGIYVACMGERILYVGQSIRLRRRLAEHKSIRNTKKHVSNFQLQEYIKQYNNKVEFIILENCDPNKLLEREQYYINLLQPEFN
jgi:hypothetical protein